MFSIRLLGPEDHALQRELLVERLPRAQIDDRLAWIYNGSPYGAAHCWVACDPQSGEAAGMTTFFPRKIWMNGVTLHGALGGDMYVRPRFRRRGIGRELFCAARRDMTRLGVEVMFGTPMPPNMTSLRSSGSTVPDDAIVRAVRLVSTSAPSLSWLPRPARSLLDPLLTPRRRGSLRLEPITGADPRVDRLWAETRGELEIATVRDATFYRWRFVDSPSRVQRPYVILDGDEPIAACALQALDEKVRVVDLLAPQDRWSTALRAILQNVSPQSGIEMRLGRADFARRRLWSSGLWGREEGPMSVLTPEGSAHAASLHAHHRWFITWADTDIDHA